MSANHGLSEYLKHPGKIITSFAARGFFNWLPDEPYIKLVFRSRLGAPLNLKNPQTFNEKLQWLKLYDRRPEHIIQVDKVSVRSFVKEKIGSEYLIPAIGVYDRVDDIPWGNLPSRFVLKCSHASTANIICVDKARLNIPEAEKKLRHWMERNWFWYGREWPYKNIPNRILAEEYLVDKNGNEINDYKFHCFNGNPKFCQVFFDRHTSKKNIFYNMRWEKQEIGRPNIKPYNGEYPKPKNFDLMTRIAEKLSKNIPYVRIDLYDVNEHVYFGEITFFPASGFNPFVPEKWDLVWGQMITLPITTI